MAEYNLFTWYGFPLGSISNTGVISNLSGLPIGSISSSGEICNASGCPVGSLHSMIPLSLRTPAEAVFDLLYPSVPPLYPSAPSLPRFAPSSMPQPLEEVFRADFDSLCSFASSSDGLGLEMEPAQAWARELIRENLRGRDTSRPAGQFSESVQAKYHILYEFAQSYSGLGMPYDEAREWALKNLKRQIHTNIFKGYYDIGYEFAYYQLDWSSDESRNFALQYSEGKCRTIRLDNTNTDLSSWHAIARGIMERALEIEENRLEIERRVLRTAADLYHTVYKQARAPGWQGGRGFSDENAKQYAKSEMLRVISR